MSGQLPTQTQRHDVEGNRELFQPGVTFFSRRWREVKNNTPCLSKSLFITKHVSKIIMCAWVIACFDLQVHVLSWWECNKRQKWVNIFIFFLSAYKCSQTEATLIWESSLLTRFDELWIWIQVPQTNIRDMESGLRFVPIKQALRSN